MSNHEDPNNTSIPIDLEQIRRWLHSCRATHGDCCNNPYTDLLSEQLGNLDLVDVITLSLVTLPSSTPFVALSYVWGDVPVCKATRENLASLQQDGAFSGTTPGILIPNTIRDAIHLTGKLGERYLWVDCLCILQDGNAEEMNRMLRAMARIYAAAEITIVDAGGDDANHGLRGIGGPSLPRTQDEVSDHYHDGYPWNSKWASRGWTFQESLFARRLLVFEGSVNWICGRDIWLETDVDSHPVLTENELKTPRLHLGVPMGMMSILPKLPNLGRWGMLVENFSMRSVTYEHDLASAFAGATEIMSCTFPGGIFQGLPELFFDIALLWQLKGPLHRRSPETPSWSWTGWKGPVECLFPWHPHYAGVYRQSGHISDWLAIALLKRTAQFRKRNLLTNELVPISNGFYQYQALRNHEKAKLLEGWSRHPFPGGHFYRWDQERTKKNARYGFPLPRADPKAPLSSSLSRGEVVAEQSSRSFSHVLHVTCPSLMLPVASDPIPYKDGLTFSSLIDPKGRIIGCLTHSQPDIVPGTLCMLLAISEIDVSQPERLEQELTRDYQLEWDIWLWEQDLVIGEDPLGAYNVLWVMKEGDVAYREGIGKVGKSAWDRLGPEMIAVDLG
ncbi:heterokaryon incompatibility protein-domain-containing protein [Lophiotrema nucula]|uniref:Heterokaryon incompatibility protein-domain-containing protein n=1 Tax=Lophiotrema nucula TaxID=690887 RepID=A0A6A5ZLW2_9PLEO|nr:heterokaryon incompatibility protein-domain-containing protein [Lophiotrema nucula]